MTNEGRGVDVEVVYSRSFRPKDASSRKDVGLLRMSLCVLLIRDKIASHVPVGLVPILSDRVRSVFLRTPKTK